MKYPRCYCLCFDDNNDPLPVCKCGHRKHNGLCLSDDQRCKCIYHRYCGNDTSKTQGICTECVLLVGSVKYTLSTDEDDECSICLEKNVFNVVLNCQHKVCHECWFGVVANTRKYNGNVSRKCPLCRDEDNILTCSGCDAHLVEGTLCKLCQFRISDFISNKGNGDMYLKQANNHIKEKVVILSSKLQHARRDIIKLQEGKSELFFKERYDLLSKEKNEISSKLLQSIQRNIELQDENRQLMANEASILAMQLQISEARNAELLLTIKSLQKNRNNFPISKVQDTTAVAVGKYKGKTFRYIYDKDQQYCDAILNLESPHPSIMKLQDYIKQRNFGHTLMSKYITTVQ